MPFEINLIFCSSERYNHFTIYQRYSIPEMLGLQYDQRGVVFLLYYFCMYKKMFK
jgi:hypothetical protein